MITTGFIVLLLNIFGNVWNLCQGSKNSFPFLDVLFLIMSIIGVIGIWPLL